MHGSNPSSNVNGEYEKLQLCAAEYPVCAVPVMANFAVWSKGPARQVASRHDDGLSTDRCRQEWCCA